MKKKICMIAHRGYSAKYLQNTELAFIQAAKHNSGGAETDVRITKDGHFVVCHDRDAVFADDTVLSVPDSTFAELTAKPLKNTLTDDEVYICTFKRYLEIMRDNGMICFIELKGAYTEEQIRDIFALADEVYDLSKCIVQSFSLDNLITARKLYPDLPIMYTYGTGEVEKGYQLCFEYGFSLDADRVVITPEIIDDFHKHGLEVAVWTVNTREQLDYFKTLDLDYIESDVFGGDDI